MEKLINLRSRIENVARDHVNAIIFELAFETYIALDQLEVINGDIRNEVHNVGFRHLPPHVTYIMFQHGLAVTSGKRVR